MKKYNGIIKWNENYRFLNFNDKFKKLKVKYKKDMKKYIVLFTSVLLLFAFIVGVSFSSLFSVSKTENKTVIEAGTLALEFYGESNSIILDEAIPQVDSDAIENNTEYEFTVKNTGTLNSTFKISLDNTCSLDKNIVVSGESIKVDKCIPNEYIKVGIKEGQSKYEILEYDKEDDEYIIDADKLATGEERNYKMKIWLALDTPNQYNAVNNEVITFSGKLNINYEQGEERYPENIYVVRYDANGGTGTMPDREARKLESITLKENQFTRTGYMFQGYSLEKDGEAVYEAGDTIKGMTDLRGGIVKFYAVWEPIVYVVKYNANGGAGTMENSTHTYDRDSILSKNEFKREGYIFAGWSTSAGGTEVIYKECEKIKNLSNTNGSIINLYAVWFPEYDTPYKVEHYVMDTSGNYPNTPTSVQKKTGTTDSILTLSDLKLTNSEYNLEGAIDYSHGVVGDEITTSTTVLSDGSRVIKLYYKRGYGFLTTVAGENIESVTIQNKVKYYYGATVPELTAILSEDSSLGYSIEFDEWEIDSDYLHISNSNSAVISSFTWPSMPEGTSLTITAKAIKKPNSYTIEYYSHDGETKYGSSAHIYDTVKNLTAIANLNVNDSSEKSFVGWAISKNATAKVYNDGAGVRNLTDVKNGVVKLYAIWSKSTQVTFYYYDGTSQASITSSCDSYNDFSSCDMTIPTVVSESGGPGLTTYVGVSDSVGTTATTTNFSNETTSYYAVYSKTITATFYYNSNTTCGGLTVSTASSSGVRYATTDGNSYAVDDANISVPSVVTASVGKYNSKYNSVSISVGNMNSSNVTTENTVYYANYSSQITIYKPVSVSAVSSSVLYRNEWFISNSGTSQVIGDSNVTISNIGTISGIYGTFKGLNSAVNDSSYSSVAASAATCTTTFYAVSTNSISISYNVNGGSGAPAAQSTTRTIYCSSASAAVATGNTTISGTKPTRTGYTFLGWYTDTKSKYDATASYKDFPLYYYADSYSDLYNAFGYNEKALYQHYYDFIINGTETRKIAPYESSKSYNIGSNITLYAGWRDATNPTTPTIEAMYDVWGSKTFTTNNLSQGSDGSWSSTGGDPFFSYADLSSFSGIYGAYVELATALSKDINVQIFYATSTTGFSADYRTVSTLKKGETRLIIPFAHSGSWIKVRFDIGNEQGLTYKIKSLAVLATPGQLNGDDIYLSVKTSEKGSGVNNWQYTYSSSASTIGSDANSTWIRYANSSSETFITTPFVANRDQPAYIRVCDKANNCSAKSSVNIRINRTAGDTTISKTVTVTDPSGIATVASGSFSMTYGSNKTISLTVKAPADKYKGSVKCTENVDSTYVTGSSSTSTRQDEIVLTNNSSNTTPSTCTVTYTNVWDGISSSSCNVGNAVSYAGNTWTVINKPSGGCGLALHGTGGSGDYSNASTYLTNTWLPSQSTLNTEKNNGALSLQSGYYVTSNSGSSNGYTGATYWLGASAIYNNVNRPKYEVTSSTFIRGVSMGVTGATSVEALYTKNLADGYKSVSSYGLGNYAVSTNSSSDVYVSGGSAIFKSAEVPSGVSAGAYYSKYGRWHSFEKKDTSTNAIYSFVERWNHDGTSWNYSTFELESTRRYNFYQCGGGLDNTNHGKLTYVKWNPNSTSNFVYSFQGGAELIADDLSASFAGYALTSCWDSEVGLGQVWKCAQATTGNKLYTRTYNLDTYTNPTGSISGRCYIPTIYTKRDLSVKLYYRPYIIVRTYS